MYATKNATIFRVTHFHKGGAGSPPPPPRPPNPQNAADKATQMLRDERIRKAQGFQSTILGGGFKPAAPLPVSAPLKEMPKLRNILGG